MLLQQSTFCVHAENVCLLICAQWNFGKFLVDKDGQVVERYGSISSPSSIEGDIKKLL